MMFRHLYLICLLFGVTAACTTTTQEPTSSQLTEIEEITEEEEEHEAEAEHDPEDEHEEDGNQREHGAHEHGIADLTIAWSGNELAIDLQTPAYNILGFEHIPDSEAEQELLEESLATLQEGSLLLILASDADCAVTEATVHTDLLEEEHTVKETDTQEEAHSDIEVAYHIQCQEPGKIESLDTSELFAHFPNFEQLHAQWVSDTQQSAKNLTPADPLLSFK
jgi:hypothetical protein